MNGDDALRHEKQLLDYYFMELSAALSDTEMDTMGIEQEWRALYPFAVADFVRCLNGWMPTHQKLNDYNAEIVKDLLRHL